MLHSLESMFGTLDTTATCFSSTYESSASNNLNLTVEKSNLRKLMLVLALSSG